jgi:hypothetical protein
MGGKGKRVILLCDINCEDEVRYEGGVVVKIVLCNSIKVGWKMSVDLALGV